MLSVLDLQILQDKLDKAVCSGLLYNKQVALERYFIRIGFLRDKHDSMFRVEAMACGSHATEERYRVSDLPGFDVDMHMRVARRLVENELNQRSYELAPYTRAENTLFVPNVRFNSNQMLYASADSQELTVDELLKVSKYSIAFAEMMQPDDPDIELASAAITVFQGIEASLSNHQQP